MRRSSPRASDLAQAALRRAAHDRAPGGEKRRDIVVPSSSGPRLTRIALARDLRREPHRRQHVARADLARRAGGARADRDAREIELDDQRLGALARQRDAGRVGKPRRTCADHDGVRRQSRARRASSSSRSAPHAVHSREIAQRRIAPPRRSRRCRDVLGAGAAAALLPAAA